MNSKRVSGMENLEQFIAALVDYTKGPLGFNLSEIQVIPCGMEQWLVFWHKDSDYDYRRAIREAQCAHPRADAGGGPERDSAGLRHDSYPASHSCQLPRLRVRSVVWEFDE